MAVLMHPGTNQVEVYKCTAHGLGVFYLVDTPGFNDTYRSDTDILMNVAAWLNRAYELDILLTGIIYLHRIIDNRMTGSAMRNLRSFQKLTGDNAMSKVVLATTFWGQTDMVTGRDNERTLSNTPNFWGSMIGRGSKVFRQDNERTSARAIIKYLIDKRSSSGPAEPLDIQRQMVDQGRTLDQTAAGQEMQAELAAQKREYERKIENLKQDLEQAIRAKDREWQEDIRNMQRENDAKARQAEDDRRKLAADNAKLMERLERVEAAENMTREQERKRQEQILAGLEYQIKTMNSNSSEAEKLKLREQLMEEKNKLDMLKWKIRQSQARCTVM